MNAKPGEQVQVKLGGQTSSLAVAEVLEVKGGIIRVRYNGGGEADKTPDDIVGIVPPPIVYGTPDPKAFRIQWDGPYRLNEIIKACGGNGLYLLAGRSISEVEGLLQYRVEGLQYCGMTTGLYVDRFAQEHDALGRILGTTLRIWLGRFLEPANPTREDLLKAEHILIYCLQPPLNRAGICTEPSVPDSESKKKHEPPRITLISEWETPKKKPDIYVHQKVVVRFFPKKIEYADGAWRMR